MRSFIFIALLNFLLIAPITAQVKIIPERQNFNQFDWECSISTSLGISKTSSKSSYENGINYLSDDKSAYSEFILSIGFFILEGLSIEPEINFSDYFSNPYISLIGNVCYTLNIPRKNIYPFAKIGYGISGFNKDEYYYGYNDETNGLFGSLDAKVISASLGIKYISSSTIAYRLEVTYKNFSNSYSVLEPYNQYTQQFDISRETIAIIFGVSFLF